MATVTCSLGWFSLWRWSFPHTKQPLEPFSHSRPRPFRCAGYVFLWLWVWMTYTIVDWSLFWPRRHTSGLGFTWYRLILNVMMFHLPYSVPKWILKSVVALITCLLLCSHWYGTSLACYLVTISVFLDCLQRLIIGLLDIYRRDKRGTVVYACP